MTTQSSTFSEGDLVTSSLFSGIAKILHLHSAEMAEIAWFVSPLESEVNRQIAEICTLVPAKLYEESTVYFRSKDSGLWCRGRYGGPRPDNKHLLIIRSGQVAVVDLADIFYPNYGQGLVMNPAHFLAARSNDAPFFYPLRERFVSAWIKQRAACLSMSSLFSSRIEIEPHQIAIACRILRDPNPKYLLADEVGLGKTIEAGLVIREHILEFKRNARVLILVPQALLPQWRQELVDRFDLADVMEDGRTTQILLRTHQQIDQAELEKWHPTLVAIDEAHQLACLAWKDEQRSHFDKMAEFCHQAKIGLLLSGTPMNGNERNYLAMLHCLNPEGWSLNESGYAQFMQKAAERERIGGIYSALRAETPNAVLESSLEELSELFSADHGLMTHVEALRPFVDFFAEESGYERARKIAALRDWIGENYRLYHRLLRNRRENPALVDMFPGLAGVRTGHWPVTSNDVTLDELLEEYRSFATVYPERYLHFSVQNGLQWLDAHFTSPLTLARMARRVLDVGAGSEEEQVLLEQIVALAKLEQKQKDDAVIAKISQWFDEHPQGKAVIFCTDEAVALSFFVKLNMSISQRVVRHNPDDPVNAAELAEHWQVLVCDKRGEDGLNLHGGHRLAVHYALSRDFNRFEQRLGRFNRYSAMLRGVSKVESLVVLPSRASLTQSWLELLDQGIGLFRQSVASLQFVLEAKMEGTWQRYIHEGIKALDEAKVEFSGHSGLIAQERKRINAQENLHSMEQDVIEVREFAGQLLQAEEDAQNQSIDLLKWITDALHFVKYSDETQGFRLRFERGDKHEKTLIDTATFIDKCMIGLDFSKGYPPTSAAMSFKREEITSSKHAVFPFRYGQPFIETIWELMQSDPRGTTMCILRMVKNPAIKLYSPALYCHFQWLVCADTGTDHSASAQRRSDALWPPRIVSFWLDDLGKEVSETGAQLLEKNYDPNGNSLYEDYNLRSERWRAVEPWFSADSWQATMLQMAEKAKLQVQQHCEAPDSVALRYQLMAMKAVILCTRETFMEEK
ncbi:SNF2-related protein [Klebsiella aerogenes]|uniref:protein DpdE n=1 Tax=Klebsiella aerogenes TaxID=548 RepID=UPI002DBB9010|nr:protein DpdE [Klebsiella aerogenes]MEB6655748.1 SNF2-related protein [Klebsiella aerogenes]